MSPRIEWSSLGHTERTMDDSDEDSAAAGNHSPSYHDEETVCTKVALILCSIVCAVAIVCAFVVPIKLAIITCERSSSQPPSEAPSSSSPPSVLEPSVSPTLL